MAAGVSHETQQHKLYRTVLLSRIVMAVTRGTFLLCKKKKKKRLSKNYNKVEKENS